MGYALICLLLMAYMIVVVPETKGRKLEEMLAYFCSLTGDTATLRLLSDDAAAPAHAAGAAREAFQEGAPGAKPGKGASTELMLASPDGEVAQATV